MANEYSGYGVSLGIYNGSTYDAVAQVRDISGPGATLDTIEVTHRDSGGVKEYVGGLLDNGEVTFDIIYDPDDTTHDDGANGLQGLQIAKTVKQMRLTLPDATPTTFTFNALVTKFEPKAPLNDAFTADVTLKVTGGLTIA